MATSTAWMRRPAGSTTSRRPTTRRSSTSSAPGSTARGSRSGSARATSRAPRLRSRADGRMGVPSRPTPASATRRSSDLVRLPSTRVVRTLVDNQRLRDAGRAARSAGPPSAFNVDAGDGSQLDGWLMKPADFDSTKVPAALLRLRRARRPDRARPVGRRTTSGTSMLTQKGYLVAIVDNRGTPAPRGPRVAEGRSTDSSACSRLGDQAVAARTCCGAAVRGLRRASASGAGAAAGSMTLNVMFRYPDLYQTGVAVAPVTD